MTPLRVVRGARASAHSRHVPVIASALAVSVLGAIIVTTEPAPDAEEPVTISSDLAVSDGESASEEDAEVAIAIPLVAYELFLARDPFEPVVEEPEPEPSAPDPADPVAPGGPTGPGPTDPSQPGGSGTTPPPDGSESGRCRGEQEVVCDGIVLTLEEVRDVDGERVAIIVVDGTRWQVREGERFAEVFELLRIQDDDSLRLIYGDELFTLRQGESALK